MPKTKTLRVGLIGYGYAGKTFHAPLINATPGLRLVAIASSRPADVLADWPDIVVKTEPDRLLAHPGLDLIVIAAPNDAHHPLARAAIAAGKHVVVDKPFTLTVREAEDLAVRAEQAGLLLSVFHNRRWDNDFIALSEMLQSGVLGDVVEFTSRFDRYRPEVKARWREANVAGAGLWYDLGPHLIDQTLQLFGMPNAVTADLALRRSGAQAVDDFHVILHYPKMRAILAASTLVSGGTARFLVQGTQGAWSVNGLDAQETWLKAGLLPEQAAWGDDPRQAQHFQSQNDQISVQALPLPAGNYAAYYAGVRDALLGVGDNPVTAAQARNVMRILELAIQSDAQGRRVMVL
ncbi:oxidoreductase [Deefgea salmonis]|uniref:Oxidoreductase n=1 Tax=Deefgea salmonis TaxID=2875502 RepID=A0ABS8BPH1_9NEIS|nr:oxidoreductase [Deefgea salmonis]MCB5197446.1 oxidoreductase [Deefgea salmonis]